MLTGVNSDEESAFAQYLINCSQMFCGLSKQQAKKLAYKFAIMKNLPHPRNWDLNEIAGEDWLRGFRKRNENESLRQPESTSKARAMVFNKVNVYSFFENVKQVLDKHANNIWNLNETGLTTVTKPAQILAEKGTKQVGRIASAKRGENVTMCCCINAIGNSLLPRANFKQHMLKGAPRESLGLANCSGWMNSDLFPQVLTHFIHFMGASKKKSSSTFI